MPVVKIPKPRPVKLNRVSLGLKDIQMKAKRQLDRQVGRDRHDLTWELPGWATSMVIRFHDPMVTKLVKYSMNKTRATLPSSAHSNPRLARPAKGYRTLHYVIELKCPLGTVTIDPMVEILP